MTVWIALLRGINVGRHRKLPMAALKALAGDLGLYKAVTHVQSGNLVFSSPEKERRAVEALLSREIEGRFGFDVGVIARSAAEWDAAIAANPFPQAAGQPKTLHAFFLAYPADAGATGRLAAYPRADEQFAIVGETLYLLTPSGIGRSKFGAAVERLLGVPATARNWNSVLKISELGHGIG